MMGRVIGIGAGVATHLLFGVTVWFLVRFLAGWNGPPSGSSSAVQFSVNTLLAAQFAVSHSLLLYPAVRERLTEWIPSAFYGCFFCVATCVSLLATIACWQVSPTVVFEWTGAGRPIVQAGFIGCWAALLYSLNLTGLGWQTGLTPWLAWVRRQPAPRREFAPRGAYRLIRHPVYLSFLGLIWLTPVVTLDRAVLIVLWTVYIGVGSVLKDQRLLFFLGDRYRDYQSRVPGYPVMWYGPLGRIPLVAETDVTPGVPVPVDPPRLSPAATSRDESTERGTIPLGRPLVEPQTSRRRAA